jgi:acetate kinase
MRILVLNAGSSSQKTCLYEIGSSLPPDPPAVLWEGRIELNGNQADIRARNSQGARVQGQLKLPGDKNSGSIAGALAELWSGKARQAGPPDSIDAAAHRIVNGGSAYRDPIVITPDVKAAIERMAASAPLHNAIELDGVEFVKKQFGDVPQVAVFDTGFHKTLPEAAYVYPGPYEWVSQGIRRFGFHGINHQYCAERAAQLLARPLSSLKIVTCHLGNGCSLAAVRGGKCVDTTMGFTPLEGLMMGTRSGSVDPGILTYLMRQGMKAAQLDETLNSKSGLLGVSGISSDMREIVREAKHGNGRAQLAFDIFVHRLRSLMGGMIASLGGIDALVFSAGIGENSAEVRAAACADFGFAGLELDAAKNEQDTGDRDIASRTSTARILVIRAQEDWAIAKEAWRTISTRTKGIEGKARP